MSETKEAQIAAILAEEAALTAEIETRTKAEITGNETNRVDPENHRLLRAAHDLLAKARARRAELTR